LFQGKKTLEGTIPPWMPCFLSAFGY